MLFVVKFKYKYAKCSIFSYMDSIFKRTLRAELDYQDVKVKELSARTGISSRTIEGYLNARGSIPPADVAFKIAKSLHVTVEYLVTGDASYNEINTQAVKTKNPIEEKISTLPIEKKRFLRDFIIFLDNYEFLSKQN